MFRTIGKSKIAFILAILFGISLFFFRGGSRYSNLFNSDNIVASVSGTPISTSKFNRTMQMNINQFNQMVGRQLEGDEIKSFQIHKLALKALINDAIFENEYEKINFKLDDTVIAQKTKERIPQLYNDKNEIDDLFLNTFLQKQQLKIEDIVQIINYETKNQFMEDAFFSINYPNYFSKKIELYNNHQREISYIKIPIKNINIEEVKNDNSLKINEVLKKFYDENINQYLSKEVRDIDYILLEKKNYLNDFIPSDYKIEEYYLENKELFFQNEKRSFIQFNFKDKNSAKKFQENIQNFKIDEIIEFANKNNIQYNKFKELSKEEILNQIATPLFNLNVNEQSAVIETSLAKHIIILEDITLAYQKKISDVREYIKETISTVEVDNYFNQLIEQISEQVLNGKSLNEISNNFNLKVEKKYKISRDYNSFDASKNIVFSNLIPEIFQANKDFVSDIKKINNEFAYLFNVENIYEAKPLEISEIKNDLYNDWKKTKKIQKIKSKLDINKKNKQFIKEIEKTYNIKSETIIINNNSKLLPKNLITKLFSSKKNLNISFEENNFFYIANLINIQIPESTSKENNILLSNDLRSSFGNELVKNKKISTNDALINAILDQY